MDQTFENIYSRETLELVKADPLVALYTLRAKRRDPVLYQALYERLAQPLGRVLDIGCGPGRFALLLAKHADAVVGLDLSPTMLRLAQELERAYMQTNATWVLGDANQLPFPPESFETIVSTHALAFTNLPEVVRQIKLLLKSGGQVLFRTTQHSSTQARGFLLSRLKSALQSAPEMLQIYGATTTWRFLGSEVNPKRYANIDPRQSITPESMQELCDKLLPQAHITFQAWSVQVEWTKPRRNG